MILRLLLLFTATLFLSIHWGAILFANSTLLSNYFSPALVSVLFILGALGNVVSFLFAPHAIEHFGKKILLILLTGVTSLSTLLLSISNSPLIIAISFILYSSLFYLLLYFIDIYVEEVSKDRITGQIRGAFLSIINLGLVLGPIALTLLAVDSLKPVYFFATLLLVPAFIIFIFIKSINHRWHTPHHRNLLPLTLWWRTKSIRRVTLAKISLEIFFAVMVIFTPLYLNGVLGFSWQSLGLIFTVMLLPFVIFQWPVGKLADHLLGEKEFMILGFLIIGGALLYMPYLGPSVVGWMAILFLSRVGASFVEVTSDSYFFKHVDAHDTGLLSIYRLARPVSIVLGSVVGALAYNIFSFEKIFFVLSIVIFFGLEEALTLRDTR